MPHQEMDGGRTTLLHQGSAAAFFADGLLGLRDDERSGKTESQPRVLSVLMQRKEGGVGAAAMGEESKHYYIFGHHYRICENRQ